jgi:hypothetical protein
LKRFTWAVALADFSRDNINWQRIASSVEVEQIAIRVRADYRDMPGLQLTFGQARVLWQLDASTCGAVLQALVDEGFLVARSDGRFVAASARAVGSALRD